MTTPELAIDTASIVIKGSFEPAKLSPQKLVTQGLVAADQLLEADQKFSTDDICILETKRIRFVVDRQTLQLTAQLAEEFETMRDMAVGILRLFDSETVSVMGINRDVHFLTASVDSWHAVGDTLVPKDIWSGVLDLVGMSSVSLLASRPDKYVGYRQITVQPSNLVTQGVFVSHNDHYTLDIADRPVTTREQLTAESRRPAQPSQEKVRTAMAVLNSEWENSMNRSSNVIERVAQAAKS
jgi:hypothetical protein